MPGGEIARRAAVQPRRSPSILVALLAVGALLVAAWTPPAQAAPLQVRGDSDEVHSLVESVTSNFPNYESATENIEFLKDRDPTRKWYARDSGQPTPANPVWAIYTLSEPALVTGYSLTSANDAPERDPKDWTILASNDPAAATDANHASWVEIDARTDERFQARFQRNVYAVANPGTYRYYQLRVTANLANSTASDNAKFQIADWTLRSGTPGYSSAIITSETEWSYLEDGTVDPSPGPDRTAWTQVGATPPGTWKTGLGPFGAKNGGTDVGPNFPVTTLLKHYLNGVSAPAVPAYFFRTTFELDQDALDSIRGLYGTLVHDDAVAIYLNGVEVFADYEGSTVTSNLQYAGGTLSDPRIKNFVIPADALREGENVVAVELHNVNDTSSDIYFALPTLAATSERVPAPYTPDELNREYPSDTMPVGDNGGDFFVDLLDGFADLLTYHPHILAPNFDLPSSSPLVAANDRVAVAINNGAVGHPAKIAQATADADGSAYTTMADGFGSVLGPLYTQAMNSGMLPKTKALLGTLIERGRDHEPAKAAYAYKRPYNRLGFVSGSQCATFTGAGRIERNYPGSYSGLCTNGSFPSGHANHGYAQGTVLATLIPELAPQILYRTSEYGNNRIVLGFHYPLDVIGGRLAGQSTAAQRWADPEFRSLLEQASDELHDVLGEACEDAGHSRDLEECAEAGDGLVSDSEALQIYTERLSYSSYTLPDGTRHDGFPVVYEAFQDTPAEIPQDAADLLRTAFPDLTDEQRELVLKATAIPGGYALDKTKDGKPSWQRINLLAAMIADVEIDEFGNTIVNGRNMGGGTPVEATLTATTQATTYNVPARVSVQVTVPASLEAEGTVRVSEGAATLAAAELADGAAELKLPKTLPAGKHVLAVSFEPTSVGVAAPPPQELNLQVKKAKAKLAGVVIKKGKARKNRIAKGARAALRVILRGVGAAAPTGKVKVKVGKATLGSANLRKRGKRYVAVVSFKARKAGRIAIAYSGAPNLKKATYRTAIAVR